MIDTRALKEKAEKLARDISLVQSLVRDRGYGTEADKPAMLERLEEWRDAACDVRNGLDTAHARIAALEQALRNVEMAIGVPLSDDGKEVFLDGTGLVPLASLFEPKTTAPPTPTQEPGR